MLAKKLSLKEMKNIRELSEMEVFGHAKTLMDYSELLRDIDLKINLLKSTIQHQETTSAMMETKSQMVASPTWRSVLRKRAREIMADEHINRVCLGSFEDNRKSLLKEFERCISDFPDSWKEAMRRRFLERKNYRTIREELGLTPDQFRPIRRKLRAMEGKDRNGLQAQHESEDER